MKITLFTQNFIVKFKPANWYASLHSSSCCSQCNVYSLKAWFCERITTGVVIIYVYKVSVTTANWCRILGTSLNDGWFHAPFAATVFFFDIDCTGRAFWVVGWLGLVVSDAALTAVVTLNCRRRLSRHSLVKQLAADLKPLVEETKHHHGDARTEHLCRKRHHKIKNSKSVYRPNHIYMRRLFLVPITTGWQCGALITNSNLLSSFYRIKWRLKLASLAAHKCGYLLTYLLTHSDLIARNLCWVFEWQQSWNSEIQNKLHAMSQRWIKLMLYDEVIHPPRIG